MVVKRRCACGQEIEFEAEDLAELKCPNCGRSLQEQFAPPRQPRPEFESRPQRQPTPMMVEDRQDRQGSGFFQVAQIILLSIIAGLALIIASQTRQVAAKAPPEPKLQRWEYHKFRVYPDGADKFFHDYLPELGSMGWELVSMTEVKSKFQTTGTDSYNTEVVFKRPLGFVVNKDDQFREQNRYLEMLQGH